MSWLRNPRARLHALFGRGTAETRANPENPSSLPGATGRWAPTGGTPGPRDARPDGRPLAWLGGLGLDLKLAVRMLVKYPGLTIIGGLAMSFAIWVGSSLPDIRFHGLPPSAKSRGAAPVSEPPL